MGIPVVSANSGELADAIACLPARYRDALVLRFYYGYSTKEIGQILSLSKGAVQKTIWRAKKMLKEELERN